MARVTYTGKAGRIRISTGAVLERLVTVEIANDVARDLPRGEFDVVMPKARRAPAARSKSTTKAKTGRARAKKGS